MNGNPPLLDGQVALVTGASRGIGQAIALVLARAGARVVGTATSPGGAEAIGASFAANGLPGRGAALDVNDPAAIDGLLADIAAREGAVGILVNNAGITRDNLLMRMDEEEWDAILDTNLKSVYRMSKAVLRPMMKARSGRIISIGSVVGSMGNAGQTNYAAAKAGMAGFTRALAREVGSRGITVNCVAPGFIDTDMTRSLRPEQREALLGQVPLGRLGDAGDVAQAVLYLASPGAAYVTGTTLHVNGGLYME
ncbi:MAG: 3-oxoacyl-ACP reductase FabG [Pseudomonadota bacterium]|jgi:3-oxoacyl-[acyl-carrier protein] reductase